MWDEKSIYLKIETGYAYSIVMKDELVEKINSGIINQVSAILKVMVYISEVIVFQHIPVKEKVKKNKVIRLRKSYVNDTLT